MPESRSALRSDMGKVDATTDEDIARQIAEDPDTAPELIDEWFDKADLHYGKTLLRRGRGRPPHDAPKNWCPCDSTRMSSTPSAPAGRAGSRASTPPSASICGASSA